MTDAPQTTTPTGAASYQADPGHTFATFEVRHFGCSTVRGRFDDVTGHVDYDEVAGTGHADITINTGSINTGVAKFDEHLRSDCFFDSSKHATAHFVGNDFRHEGGKLAAVAGDLTLLGVTRPVVLTCNHFSAYESPVLNAHVAGGDFETTLKRSDWGMRWGLDIGLPDAVHLVIQIEAARQ